MAASNSSAQSLSNPIPKPTPGAFPSTSSPAESPNTVSSQLTLAQAVRERRAEYTRPQKIKVKVGTWNVASLSGTEKDIGAWFVDGKGVSESLSGLSIGKENGSPKNSHLESSPAETVESQESRRSKKKSTLPKSGPGSLPGREEIGIYALGLQEIVDVGSAAEALRPFSDPHPGRKWKQAVAEALPKGYQCVAEQQLIGLFLVIYASSAVAPLLSSVSTTSVGTGLMGYMGNKGAVTARIVLGEATRMVFINCHLSAGAEKGSLERRNWDASQIQSRTKFDPVYDGGGVMEEFSEGIGDEDFAFWFGDLNYRLESLPAEDVRRLLMLHTRNEYGKPVASKQKIEQELANPESNTFAKTQGLANQASEDGTSSVMTAVSSSADGSGSSYEPDPLEDPTSLQSTLHTLLSHDQLRSQMSTRKAFHDGWREGEIDFLPTYKYDVGSVGMFDSSEKRRGPSWCDRILFRTRKDRLDFESRLVTEEQAKKKDNEMKLRGMVEEAANEEVLFDNDPDNNVADNEFDDRFLDSTDPECMTTKDNAEDRLHLDYYTSHQRVLSSDHKPLDAVFTLSYDAVNTELKARVHQEIARELDKAENDGRPIVTVVVDHHRDSDTTHTHTDPASQNHEGVNFGNVKFDHLKTRTVTIANTGRVPATVGFADRSSDASQPGGICPPWIGIQFDRPSDNKNPNPGALQDYTLQPGDAANVELSIHVTDLDFVRQLSDGDENLEDVLVLRIHNGRDYFLPLRATWLQSAFGRSVEKLIRIPEGGVRRWQHQKPDGSSHSDHDVKWSAPRELFRLTEAIEELVERATAEWGMRGEEGVAPWEKDIGWPFRGLVSDTNERRLAKEMAREALDTDTPFGQLFPPELGSVQRLEALAETLVQFLKSIDGGIIPDSVSSGLEKGMLEREKAKKILSEEEERIWVLDTLSAAPAHSVSFTFITFMLSRLLNEIAPEPRRLQRQGTATSFAEMEVVQNSNDSDPAKTRRKDTKEAYAALFADSMIRLPATLTNKASKLGEIRMKNVVGVFMTAETG